jgi:hypothetical protein
MRSKVPTFPFTFPTGGAVPPCVSQSYPENLNSAGPSSEDELPDDPLLEPVEDDDPLLEEPLPEVVEEPLDDPLEEPPEPVEELPPEDPPWAGAEGMAPPPHPARKTSDSTKTLILGMRFLSNPNRGLISARAKWICNRLNENLTLSKE